MRGIDKTFPSIKPRALIDNTIDHVPVLVVGAGPVGLAACVDLALHGIKSILIDDDNKLSTGSRAICWAKRSLEIFDRLGVADALVEKGVTWKVGRLFHGDSEVYSFDLLPEAGHKMPAFINLPQYYVEDALVSRTSDFTNLIELRWKARLESVSQNSEGVVATVSTPDGSYDIKADYLIACDGAHSTVRKQLALDFAGEAFEERFLIADIVMEADFPPERWFWFDPPFHRGHSVLLHKQPDNLYRIDFSLGRNADAKLESDPRRVAKRIEAMLPGRAFEMDWLSVYSFQCRRLEKFRHNRIFFAGDAAHLVSPFGARGGNSGIQDADNLVWKLAAVMQGDAPDALLDSYDTERIPAADENSLQSSRATRFIAPRSKMEESLQQAVLALASEHVFARKLVNSGRLSTPFAYTQSPFVTKTESCALVGHACPDAPLKDGWLLNLLPSSFCVLSAELVSTGLPQIKLEGETALQRFGSDRAYLIRPDRHIAACVPAYDTAALDQAHRRALGFPA